MCAGHEASSRVSSDDSSVTGLHRICERIHVKTVLRPEAAAVLLNTDLPCELASCVLAQKKNSPDVKSHPASVPRTPTSSLPQVPEKVPRVRTSSVTAVTSPPVVQARKRTSSGVFQVDETEPPPKKTEHTRSNSDGALKKIVTNGRRKVTETSESEGERKGKEKRDKTEGKKERKDKVIDKGERKKVNSQEEKGMVIERFDSKGESKRVSAFKESDSWD